MIEYLVGGLNPSEKYEKVSWDYIVPNIWKSNIDVPNHQPDIIVCNIHYYHYIHDYPSLTIIIYY